MNIGRFVSGLIYGALGTALLLVVFVAIARFIGAHGGSAGATAEAAAAHFTGLNA